ncbi:hypothetical protein BOX15_Mlig024808g1 [Macrostomum lignano]|uniref:Rab3-GAP regulatory subunit N-terminal domain-containing protein n=3 Tax=Macrostomum lignano TaxID=282301 RepID=A0A267H8X1_9PLAT|nr:hypothetical protein BOX15_Mlig024808g1 [Macrostomum lignano]
MATLQSIASISSTVAVHNTTFGQIIKGSNDDESIANVGENPEMSWDNDWSWDDDEQLNQAADLVEDAAASNFNIDWSHEDIMYSLSPLADVVVFANSSNIVCLRRHLDGNEVAYQLLFDHFQAESPSVGPITSVLCLPLATHKQSLQGSPEWTCVMIGHESGHVTFLAETGDRVLTQFWHSTPVQGFKYNSYKAASHSNERDSQEELSILHTDALVVVDGQSLCQTLKACRSQLARSASGVQQQQQQQQQQQPHQQQQAMQLAFKKWALRDQREFVDHANLGLRRTNPFDQLVTASLVGGPYATIRPTPPVYSVFVTAGQSPFVGFFYASEDQWQPLLSNATELAFAVATKVKSALLSAAASWLTGGGSQASQSGGPDATDGSADRRKVEPATPLSLRYGLMDKRRQGVAVAVCPYGRYCAVVDAFGRVTLVGLEDGTALRMWKGYRGAQVGWVAAQDTSGKGGRALFLVIYASRRGLLEVWTACHGPRVAAFNVSRQGRLLYCPHSLMGLSSLNARHYTTGYCYFLDSNRSIKAVNVPYHLAFTDANSYQTHDTALLKQLRQTLRESPEFTEAESQRLRQQLSQFRLVSYLEQAVDRLIGAKQMTQPVLDACLRQALDMLTGTAGSGAAPCLPGSSAGERAKLGAFVASELELLNAYTLVRAVAADSAETGASGPGGAELASLPQPERLGDDVNLAIGRLFARLGEKLAGAQTGDCAPEPVALKPPFSVPAFLNMFFCVIEKAAQQQQEQQQEQQQQQQFVARVQFRAEASLEDKARLGEFLAQSYLAGHVTLEDQLAILRCDQLTGCGVLLESLACHLLLDWRRAFLCSDWLARFRLLFADALRLLSMAEAGAPAAVAECLCGLAASADQPPGALLLTLLLIDCGGDFINDEAIWEKLDQLAMKLRDTESLWLCMDTEPLSVKMIEQGSRGLVGELLARRLVGAGLGPADLERFFLDESADADFALAHAAFPLSLQFDVLAANCAWEAGLAWVREPDRCDRLSACLAYMGLLGSGSGCLKQGLSSMLWHVHFCKPLQSLAFLADKAGRQPGDRATRRELGMSAAAACEFAALMADFLSDCFHTAYADVVPALAMETLWDNPAGRLSLCELALDQTAPVPEAVRQHRELSRALHLILSLRLSVRLFSLFPSKLLFRSLTSSATPSSGGPASQQNQQQQPHHHQSASSADAARSNFLLSAMRAAVRMPRDDSASDQDVEQRLVRGICRLAEDWFGGAGSEPGQMLLDRLRRSRVRDLFAMGRDAEAEALISSVSQRFLLASDLLTVIGARLHRLDKTGQLSVLSIAVPSVSAWIESCDTEDVFAELDQQQQQQHSQEQLEADMAGMKRIMRHLLNDMRETQDDYKLALQVNDLLACF